MFQNLNNDRHRCKGNDFADRNKNLICILSYTCNTSVQCTLLEQGALSSAPVQARHPPDSNHFLQVMVVQVYPCKLASKGNIGSLLVLLDKLEHLRSVVVSHHSFAFDRTIDNASHLHQWFLLCHHINDKLCASSYQWQIFVNC